MRMMPSIFGEDLFDEWMDFPFEREFFGRKNPQSSLFNKARFVLVVLRFVFRNYHLPISVRMLPGNYFFPKA